jgi:asparagine synthase (glutamine-hydrolysing)
MKMKNENDLVKNIFELKSNGLAEKQSTSSFYDFIFKNKKTGALQKALDYNIKFWLNNDSNVKVDRASMSASLEVRSPLLDFRVIEFARTLPTSFSFENGEKKKILKEILYPHIPKEMMNRPKRGFTMPFELWFRNELKELVRESLSDANLKKLPMLDSKNIHQMVANHINGKENNYTTIWNLMVLMNWMKYNKASI